MINNNYIKELPETADKEAILELRAERESLKKAANLSEYRDALTKLAPFKTKNLNLDSNEVTIGSKEELNSEQQESLKKALEAFIPWKKGPFNLFGYQIDSEWRSDLKWKRILPHCGSLEGKVIADIGCNNGYFMFRMAAQNPKLVIGFEPYAKHWLNFKLMQQYAQIPSLHFELLGAEHVNLYKNTFDKVFSLGILYHHKDPIGLLDKAFESLKPGGEIIVDCQGIPGNGNLILIPEKRYAKARGVWFVPTLSALTTWLRRSRFQDIQCFYSEPLSSEEQRTTKWAPINSLKDFLDPDDKTKTIEGYPAPHRFYVKAKKH